VADSRKPRHSHCHAGPFLLRLTHVIGCGSCHSIWNGGRRTRPLCRRRQSASALVGFQRFRWRFVFDSRVVISLWRWWRWRKRIRAGLHAYITASTAHRSGPAGRVDRSRLTTGSRRATITGRITASGFGNVLSPSRKLHDTTVTGSRSSTSTRPHSIPPRSHGHRHGQRSERHPLRRQRHGTEPNPHRHRLLI
jgi:hypothetical protein